MKIIKIENIELSAESLLTTNEVAIIYGVTAQTIREHKRTHQDELIEDRHFKKIKVDTKGGKQTKIFCHSHCPLLLHHFHSHSPQGYIIFTHINLHFHGI